jgi:hypothetical protein
MPSCLHLQPPSGLPRCHAADLRYFSTCSRAVFISQAWSISHQSLQPDHSAYTCHVAIEVVCACEVRYFPLALGVADALSSLIDPWRLSDW